MLRALAILSAFMSFISALGGWALHMRKPRRSGASSLQLLGLLRPFVDGEADIILTRQHLGHEADALAF